MKAISLRQIVAVPLITAWMVTCDHIFHVSTRTVVHYWMPQIDGQTVWVAGFFGVGALAIVLIAPQGGRPNPARWWIELVLLTLLYGISGWFGQAHAPAVTALFFGLFAIRFAIEKDRRTIGWLALLLGVAGPLAESFAWAIGEFAYTQPDVIGVPWWLFGFYLNGAFAARELGPLLATKD